MFPSEGYGDIVEFENFSKQMRIPFIIYCDFEAFGRKLDTCFPDPSRSNATMTVKHVGMGIKLLVRIPDIRNLPLYIEDRR
jgi:hypothetical protein